MKQLRWLPLVSLLLLSGCAAARLASLAGKAGSAGKVVSAGGKVAGAGSTVATAGKVASTGAKVGVAAEGAQLARGGTEAAEAGHALKAAAPAEEAARVTRVGTESSTGSQLGEAAQTAVDLAGIELPSGSEPRDEPTDSMTRHWALSKGRALEGRRDDRGVEFQLKGFQPSSIPQVEVILASRTLVSPAGATRFRFEGLNLQPGNSLQVSLRSGQQKVPLQPWKRP